MWRSRGVIVEEEEDEEKEMKITTVRIETENGAKAMKKPVGTYITMEAPGLAVPDEDYHREIAETLAGYLKQFLTPRKKDSSVLVAGLGNRKVTPDALGPLCCGSSEHFPAYRKRIWEVCHGRRKGTDGQRNCSGVMGQTGMETVEIIKGIVKETRPDILVVIDALAARSSRRLKPDDPDQRCGGSIRAPAWGITGAASRRPLSVFRSLPSACPRLWKRQRLSMTPWKI